METDQPEGTIDESLYSRQLYGRVFALTSGGVLTVGNVYRPSRYVLGAEAMLRMGASDVLIVGLKGLGVEIGGLRVVFFSGRCEVLTVSL